MNSKFTSTLAIGQYEIIKYIHKGLVIPSCTKRTEYSILEIDDNYITIKGKQTKKYDIPFKGIIKAYSNRLWEGGQKNGFDPYNAAIALYIYKCLAKETV